MTTRNSSAISIRRPRSMTTAVRYRATARELADRAHAAGDAHALASGWAVTRTPGPLGLAGRTYWDPRFATRRSPA